MELFSHVHPVTPLVIYLPLMGYMLYLAAVQRALPLGVVAGLVVVRHPDLELGRVHDAPLGFSLPTEEQMGKAPSLHAPWRAPRLPERCQSAGHATNRERTARHHFLWTLRSPLWPLRPSRVRRSARRLSFLRHATLCDSSFSDETRRLALAKKISHAAPLPGRSCRLRGDLSALGSRFRNKVCVGREWSVRSERESGPNSELTGSSKFGLPFEKPICGLT